ncbi:MAG: hypothetical protein ACYS0D_12135 [Planctomycetota bacterium]|jgi:hypothetical protein
MSLATSRARLHGALKELRARWDQAKAKWDDPMSRDFEKRYLSPLEPRVRSTVTAMEKMDAILAQARRDCG